MDANRIAAVVGPAEFNKLIAAVAQTRKKGRLRYWQEPLLRKIEDATGIAVTTLDGYVSVFDQLTPAEIRREPWTRGSFLKAIAENPLAASFAKEELADEWIAAAWQVAEVRNAWSGDIARDVSKVGELCTAPQVLSRLERVLSIDQIVELFHLIRRRSPTRESEFRPQFERVFAKAVNSLPPPLDEDDDLWEVYEIEGWESRGS